jgi:hypothetical protein
MPNYTKPNNEDYEDKPEDWLFCSLLFAGALGFLLKPGRGIFLKLSESEREMHPEIKYVIVWNDGVNMAMMDASDRTDLKEGDHIIMIPEEELPNAN